MRPPSIAGLSLRSFLQIGTPGLGSLTLPDLLRLRAQAPAEGRTASDSAVILLWLDGGPSQFETYDPKPDAPAEYRGPLTPIISADRHPRPGQPDAAGPPASASTSPGGRAHSLRQRRDPALARRRPFAVRNLRSQARCARRVSRASHSDHFCRSAPPAWAA